MRKRASYEHATPIGGCKIHKSMQKISTLQSETHRNVQIKVKENVWRHRQWRALAWVTSSSLSWGPLFVLCEVRTSTEGSSVFFVRYERRRWCFVLCEVWTMEVVLCSLWGTNVEGGVVFSVRYERRRWCLVLCEVRTREVVLCSMWGTNEGGGVVFSVRYERRRWCCVLCEVQTSTEGSSVLSVRYERRRWCCVLCEVRT